MKTKEFSPEPIPFVHRLGLAVALAGGIVLMLFAWSGIYQLGRADAKGAPRLHEAVMYGPAPEFVVGDGPIGMTEMGQPLYFQGLPDVLEQPAESVDLVTKLWREGHISNAIIVLAFLGLTLASRKFPWFSDGHRAVYVAAAIGGLGILAESASMGTTPNVSMVLAAAMTTCMLIINAKAPAQVAAGLPVARALRSPAALSLEPRPNLRRREESAILMHQAFTESMGMPQHWKNLSADTQTHWLAAAAALEAE